MQQILCTDKAKVSPESDISRRSQMSAERTFVAFGDNLPTPSQISCLFWKVIPVLQFIAYPSRTVARANIGLIDRQSEQGAAAAER